MTRKISVITKAKGWCKNCKRMMEMEIMEVEKSNVVARCPKCGTIYLIPLNIEEYFKTYQNKGGKNE